MKKLFGIIITLMLNITILPHAMVYSGEFPLLTESIDDGIYLTDFFGEEYFFFDVCETSPRKYEKNEYDFFLEESKKKMTSCTTISR